MPYAFSTTVCKYLKSHPEWAKFDMKLIQSSDNATSPLEKFEGSWAGKNGSTAPVADSTSG